MPAERRRQGILDAAVEVFGQRGYHRSSIDEIATAAGVSKALIYEHFSSKKDLQASLLELYVGELFSRLSANAATGEQGEVRLRRGLEAFFGFVEEHRGGWRMLFRDAADPDLAEQLAQVQDQGAALVAGLIAAEPAPDHPGRSAVEGEQELAMLAQLLSGAMQWLATWWLEHPDVPRERVVEQAMAFAWVGLDRLREGERYEG